MTESTSTVMIVDDDADMRDTIREVLTDRNVPVVVAENGAEALERLHDDHVRPCVILLDMMMPVMDGRRFRELQRDDPELARIPVVVITAHSFGAQTAREMEADGFLRKPFELQELLTTIERYRRRAP